uniref:Uncharacterized protein n=1 Tax=Podoviridae sp. ctoqT5 TaxID=2826577 RepID=A0A8S5MPL9_9CAUD|nr:MAG TPA: hypothetical protein [Podoviridae sp. ctoqT5]
MAKVTITSDKLTLNDWKALTFTAGTTDGFKVPATNGDWKRVVLVQNTDTSAAITVTVKQGNGIQGVKDLDAFSIPAGKTAAIRLDDGRYKNVSGEDKDYILIVPSSTKASMSVVELP